MADNYGRHAAFVTRAGVTMLGWVAIAGIAGYVITAGVSRFACEFREGHARCMGAREDFNNAAKAAGVGFALLFIHSPGESITSGAVGAIGGLLGNKRKGKKNKTTALTDVAAAAAPAVAEAVFEQLVPPWADRLAPEDDPRVDDDPRDAIAHEDPPGTYRDKKGRLRDEHGRFV